MLASSSFDQPPPAPSVSHRASEATSLSPPASRANLLVKDSPTATGPLPPTTPLRLTRPRTVDDHVEIGLDTSSDDRDAVGNAATDASLYGRPRDKGTLSGLWAFDEAERGASASPRSVDRTPAATGKAEARGSRRPQPTAYEDVDDTASTASSYSPPRDRHGRGSKVERRGDSRDRRRRSRTASPTKFGSGDPDDDYGRHRKRSQHRREEDRTGRRKPHLHYGVYAHRRKSTRASPHYMKKTISSPRENLLGCNQCWKPSDDESSGLLVPRTNLTRLSTNHSETPATKGKKSPGSPLTRLKTNSFMEALGRLGDMIFCGTGGGAAGRDFLLQEKKTERTKAEDSRPKPTRGRALRSRRMRDVVEAARSGSWDALPSLANPTVGSLIGMSHLGQLPVPEDETWEEEEEADARLAALPEETEEAGSSREEAASAVEASSPPPPATPLPFLGMQAVPLTDPAVHAELEGTYTRRRIDDAYREDVEAVRTNVPCHCEGKPGEVSHVYSEVAGDNFMLRGQGYLEDRKKVPSAASMFACLGVESNMHDAAASLDWCRREGGYRSRLEEACHGAAIARPFLLVVNLILPWGNLVSYFYRPDVPENGPYKNSCAHEPHERAWRAFLEGDEKYRNQHFKFIPNISAGPWVIKKLVGSKPCLIGLILPVAYFGSVEDNYLEICLDVTKSSVANSITNSVASRADIVSVDMAFLIEATEEELLPERLLGAFRLHHICLKKKGEAG